MAYQSLGRFDESIAALERARALWPALGEIQTRLDSVRQAKARAASRKSG
jgi:hypothetical protein